MDKLLQSMNDITEGLSTNEFYAIKQMNGDEPSANDTTKDDDDDTVYNKQSSKRLTIRPKSTKKITKKKKTEDMDVNVGGMNGVLITKAGTSKVSGKMIPVRSPKKRVVKKKSAKKTESTDAGNIPSKSTSTRTIKPRASYGKLPKERRDNKKTKRIKPWSSQNK